MKRLYDEVLRRFPEARDHLLGADQELPYLVIGAIARWLKIVAKPTLDPSIIERVVEFHNWCRSQPNGVTAADDIPTIEMVALVEKLFAHDELLPLVARLMSHHEMLVGRDYLVAWVGADRYQAALNFTRMQESKKGRKRQK